MLTIEVIKGPRAGESARLEPPVSIGRDPTSKLTLDDAEVSFENAQIFREGPTYYLQDLAGVAHASRIHRGAEELRLRGTTAVPLRDGDIVHLGSPGRPVILAVHIDEPGGGEGEVKARDWVRLGEFQSVAEKVARDAQAAPRLLAATQKLARRGLDKREVFAGVAEAVFDLLPRATHVAIALAEADFKTVYGRARGDRRPQDGSGELARVPRAVIARVLEMGDALITDDTIAEFGASSETTVFLRIKSTVAAPLWDGERVRGVIHAFNRDTKDEFAHADLQLLVTLAAQAALAIENASLVERLRIAQERLRGENHFLKHREERRRTPNIVGDSRPMQLVLDQIEKVKDQNVTVCIEGETGTGKELIASNIHYQGARRDKLFVAQNCAAIPDNLLESELFGYKRGAFTGADHDKKGLFEIADGGTLFLDEIGEMSLGLQAKLLRVLQDRQIRPVGATQARPVDVRIICATNRALDKEVEKGTFRQDLYYRLRVYPIRVPPLRERREDIAGLVEHFLGRYCEEMKKPIAGILPETIDQLTQYTWPGNIRELENEVQRLVIQADADTYITPEMLSPQVRKVEELLGRVAPQRKTGTLKERVEEVERWLLTEALREHGGNKTRTAETLGITREGLHKKLSKYGL